MKPRPEGMLSVFMKPPVPGTVKTRLQPLLGADGAARVAAALLCDTWERLQRLPWGLLVAATTGPIAEVLEVRPPAEVWDQGPGDLGQRLQRVLCRGLARESYALGVGADVPGLPLSAVTQARAMLHAGAADAVLGPAHDGGFYLIGFRRCPPSLLAQGIPWSQADTLARTIARLSHHGLSYQLLEPWHDLDLPEDVTRTCDHLRRRDYESPALAQTLRNLGLLCDPPE